MLSWFPDERIQLPSIRADFTRSRRCAPGSNGHQSHTIHFKKHSMREIRANPAMDRAARRVLPPARNPLRPARLAANARTPERADTTRRTRSTGRFAIGRRVESQYTSGRVLAVWGRGTLRAARPYARCARGCTVGIPSRLEASVFARQSKPATDRWRVQSPLQGYPVGVW